MCGIRAGKRRTAFCFRSVSLREREEWRRIRDDGQELSVVGHAVQEVLVSRAHREVVRYCSVDCVRWRRRLLVEAHVVL